MNREEARKIALEYVSRAGEESGIDLQLLDEETLERDFGWVFFYDSAKYAVSRSHWDSVLGNAPIIVTRDGALHETGTAHPVEYYIEEFEKEMKK